MAQTPAQPERLNKLIAQYCSPEWQELLNERYTQLTFLKGEHIFKDGQVATHMFMIHRGRVKVLMRQTGDRERIIRVAGDGEVLGHRAIGDKPTYTATVTALSDTRMNTIPMPLFLSTLRANNLFCYHFLLYFAEEMRQLDQDMRDLMELDVPQRVAKTLLRNLDTFGLDEKDKRKFAFTMTRRDIASMAGTTYESVIRTLADFQQQGIIQLVGKEIRLLKKRELERAMRSA